MTARKGNPGGARLEKQYNRSFSTLSRAASATLVIKCLSLRRFYQKAERGSSNCVNWFQSVALRECADGTVPNHEGTIPRARPCHAPNIGTPRERSSNTWGVHSEWVIGNGRSVMGDGLEVVIYQVTGCLFSFNLLTPNLKLSDQFPNFPIPNSSISNYQLLITK